MKMLPVFYILPVILELTRCEVVVRHNNRIYRYVGDPQMMDGIVFPDEPEEEDRFEMKAPNITDLSPKNKVPEISQEAEIRSTNPDQHVPNKGIPDSVLMKLRDIEDPNEFLKNLVAQDKDKPFVSYVFDGNDDGSNETEKIEDRRIPQLPKITKPAGCTPSLKTIELKPPSEDSEMFFPWCVRIPRCTGCCPSRRLQCSPSIKTFINITVVKVKYVAVNQKLKFQGLQVFRMEKHDSCTCDCIQKPTDCSKKQVFKAEDCLCVCSNLDQAHRCIKKNRIWDPQNCECQCKINKFCSTGFFFNKSSCECENNSIETKLSNHINTGFNHVKLPQDNEHEKMILSKKTGQNGFNPDFI